MGDTRDEEDDDLTKAVVLWTGRGTRSWPHRDDAALVQEFGDARSLALLVTIQALHDDF